MFRDSKEYQEIAKIYAEKVSKPENLDEMGPIGKTRVTPFKDTSMGKGEKVKITPFKDTSMGKGEDVKVKSFKDTSMGQKNDEAKKQAEFNKQISNIRKTEPENQSKEFGPKGQPSASVQIKRARLAGKTGKERAQELAKMRKESGKTIQQVKDDNTASMRARAAERNKAFKEKQDAFRAKKASKNKPTATAQERPVEKPTVQSKPVEKTTKPTETNNTAKKKLPPSIDIKPSGIFKDIGKSKTNDSGSNKKAEASKKRRSNDTSSLNVSSTKKNTQKNNSKFENNPNVKNFRKDVKDLKTTAKYGSTATIQTLDGKEYKPGDPGYEAELKKARSMVQKSMKKEEFTPYDIVLEYLLSTEQVATIEEANYVMTEMDAETIQGIVNEGLGSAIKKVGKAAVDTVKKGGKAVGDTVKKGVKKLKGGELKGDFPSKGDTYSV